jgi:hydrogenase maturation protease
MDLTPYLQPFDALIVIDAVNATGVPPGTVKSYRKRELLQVGPALVMSPHQPTLREALMRLELFDGAPAEVLLVGAVPAHLELAEGLSTAVRAAVPAIVAAVLEELARLGTPAQPKAAPRTPVFWWERSPSLAGDSDTRGSAAPSPSAPDMIHGSPPARGNPRELAPGNAIPAPLEVR